MQSSDRAVQADNARRKQNRILQVGYNNNLNHLNPNILDQILATAIPSTAW